MTLEEKIKETRKAKRLLIDFQNQINSISINIGSKEFQEKIVLIEKTLREATKMLNENR